MRVVAEDLLFPEGPIWLEDGSLLVVEIRRKTLTRIWGQGRKEIVAHLGGGPNGAAIGPDGACYICNNGGFDFVNHGGIWMIAGAAKDYNGAWIERVQLDTGKVERLYERAGDVPLCGPNDIVFDATGNFYFTDLGKGRAEDVDLGAIYYAAPDGGAISEVIGPIGHPNGIGLSPNGKSLYVAETLHGRLYRWDVLAPGVVRGLEDRDKSPLHGGELLFTPDRYQLFDSLAVEEDGRVCVGTLARGGITIVSPDDGSSEFVPVPQDIYITNICFGGAERRQAYITCSYAGVLLEAEWPRPGLKLAF